MGAGLMVGLPLAWFASKLMGSMLFKLSAHDPLSFVAAGGGDAGCLGGGRANSGAAGGLGGADAGAAVGVVPTV